jgi:hypothetical protein
MINMALAMFTYAQAQETATVATSNNKTNAQQTVSTEPASTNRTGRHLFVLSGQSNMFHMPADEFAAVVTKEFGEGNVSIAKSAKTGAAIRFWDKDFPWEGEGAPQGRKQPGKPKVTKEEYVARFGELYEKLWASVKTKTDGKPFDSVTFVWMQGESDSNRDPEIYFQSFERVVARLKADLEIDSINIVIGRLSDCGNAQEHWLKFREGQVKYAEAHPNCKWINTDDLNDKVKDDGTTVNDLHYTTEGYKILARRFAEKAIQLIRKK